MLMKKFACNTIEKKQIVKYKQHPHENQNFSPSHTLERSRLASIAQKTTESTTCIIVNKHKLLTHFYLIHLS